MVDQKFSLPENLRGPKDIKYWAGRYPDFEREKDDQLERMITCAMKDERGLTCEELRFLCVWKSGPRNLHHLPDDKTTIACLSRKAFENECVRPLCELPGIQIPTASAALHFAFPEKFPVIDRRVLVTTGRIDPEDKNKIVGLALWDEYVKWCVPAAAEREVSLRDFDRALWQYDVETSFKKKYWPRQNLPIKN